MKSPEQRMIESVRSVKQESAVEEAKTAADLGYLYDDEVDWDGMEYLDIELQGDKLYLPQLKDIVEDNLYALMDTAYNVQFEKDSIPLYPPIEGHGDGEFTESAFFDVFDVSDDEIRIATGEATFAGVWLEGAEHPILDSVHITRYREL